MNTFGSSIDTVCGIYNLLEYFLCKLPVKHKWPLCRCVFLKSYSFFLDNEQYQLLSGNRPQVLPLCVHIKKVGFAHYEKNPKIRVRNLEKLGIAHHDAMLCGNARKKY
ncbi:MAG: hypothetical protein RBR67_18370 [Desulfobacterium sp.]|nr:hypothetical protein [Desulfobacterium sp.]